MAQNEFILQGFSNRSHVDAVRELFDVSDIDRVLLSVAYIKESGVAQIENQLRANAANVTVFAGIRNDITSYQALRRLHEITGITLYAFDTGGSHTTFHPKIYFVRGSSYARLVVGSANLTLGGLQNNIEAGMRLDFDLTDAADRRVVDQIASQVEAMPEAQPSNVVKIESLDDLETMFDNGLITDELDIPPPRPTRSGTAGIAQGTGDRVPRIRLQLPQLRSSRLGVRTRPARHNTQPISTDSRAVRPAAEQAAPLTAALELVWQSKPLTERDLNIPSGTNTHRTGSINLDKGLLPKEVDHRHYFREELFPHHNWTLNRAGKVEHSFAKFSLVLRGVRYGEFDLELSHTVSTTSRSYLQKNAMTRLRWGPIAELVGQPDLKDRTLSLYRNTEDATRFLIEID